MNKLLPNFLIVGAAKSGTTSLFYYFNQHPDIFIPSRKEGRFFSQLPGSFQGPGVSFANDIISDIAEYKKLFEGFEHIPAKGDASNDYLYYYKNSIECIKKYLEQDIRILIVLRNPVDRAYSQYLHHIREGWESLSFEDALEREEYRRNQNWQWAFFYKDVGLYYESVKAFLENFKNIKVLLFEDLFQIIPTLKDLFEFIGVSVDFEPDTKGRYNASGFPKNNFVDYLLKLMSTFRPAILPISDLFMPRYKQQQIISEIKSKNLRKIPMNQDTREELKNYFYQDISMLSKLIDRDLSSWLK